MQPPPFIRPDVQAAPPVIPPDEPAAKKSKVDAGPEANLMPENIFLQNHSGTVKFQVQVPDIPDKTEWKCKGQKIFLTLPWTDQVTLFFCDYHYGHHNHHHYEYYYNRHHHYYHHYFHHHYDCPRHMHI
jgi:hypothetical protein